MANIDFQELNNGFPTHNINWEKYNSISKSYKTFEELFKEEKDFIDTIFMKLTGKDPKRKEKKLLLKSMLLSSMGTGYHPPSILIPKLISSTTKDKKFAIINGLIGGLSSLGTDHLGAICDSMHLLKSFENSKENEIKEYIKTKLNQKEKIRGFGHPVYKKDPRPQILLTEIKKTYKKNIYIEIFNTLSNELIKRKNIFPNIDSALAVSYNSLGFEPEQGIYLSFISRSIGMVSHILEEFPKKPFSFLNEAVPKEII